MPRSYRFCPYERVDLLDRSNNFAYMAHLGQYGGVIRAYNDDAACNAMVGQIFVDGDMCNGAPRMTNVTFVCLDVTAPQEEYYARVPQIFDAYTADGCSYALDLPIAAACSGPSFGLCADSAPTTNPQPSPSPSFAYSDTFIPRGNWTDVMVTAYAMGSSAPPSVRLVTADGAATPPRAPEVAPGLLPPSASPIPVPFPGGLLLLGLYPSSGGPGTNVTVMAAEMAKQKRIYAWGRI